MEGKEQIHIPGEEAMKTQQMICAMYESGKKKAPKKVGKTTNLNGFYRLLKRQGWRKLISRPHHPKKADAREIEVQNQKDQLQLSGDPK